MKKGAFVRWCSCVAFRPPTFASSALVCVDVRVTALPPFQPMQPHSQTQEHPQRREYSHDTPAAANGLQPLFHGILPAVFDVAGQCSPACQQLLGWL
eukprot:6023826-Amphidinium_carterae.1